MDLNKLTIKEAQEKLKNTELTSVELTKACLNEIKEMDGAWHAYLNVFEERALEEAKKSDKRRLDGESCGDLDGIPLAIKDNIMIQNTICTAGSKILSNYKSVFDATVIKKLKNEGAVILGKTNMDEFAMGSSTESSAFGATKNLHDPERVPGGSSGGSAVAVAGDMALGALGSDTGGSIRQPASFCGVVGLKPTYGRVSRSGLIAMASSFDQIGPLTKTVEDAAIIFSAIQGQDVKDDTTSDIDLFKPVWVNTLERLRVGVPYKLWAKQKLDPRVEQGLNKTIEEMKAKGAEIVDLDLPYVEESLAVYYLLMPSEVSANLSRFDGIRYGLRKSDLSLFETYEKSRSEGLGAEVKRRILLGTFALSAGYKDAYYNQAKKVQTLIRDAYKQAFERVDVILTPTTPTSAFKIGEKIDDPLAMYLDDVFTVSANVAGLPAISIPVDAGIGLPVGMQITGKWFEEATILAVAKIIENK